MGYQTADIAEPPPMLPFVKTVIAIHLRITDSIWSRETNSSLAIKV